MPTPFVTEMRNQGLAGGVASRSWLFVHFEDAVAVDARLKLFLADEVPLQWGGLPIRLPATIRELGGGIWEVTPTYSAEGGSQIVSPGGTTSPAPNHGSGGADPVPPDYSWSVGGGTRHITQSYKTRQRAYRNDSSTKCRDFGGAIGVSIDAQGRATVAGCDVLGSEVAWQAVGQIPAASFTGAYAKTIERLHAHTNETPFFGYPAGEVLFAGATVEKANASGMRPAAFDFLVKRNKDTLVVYVPPGEVVSQLELSDVRGWSHVWCTYQEVEQTNGGVKTKALLPLEAYEEQVYPEADLNDLGIQARRVPPPPPPPP